MRAQLESSTSIDELMMLAHTPAQAPTPHGAGAAAAAARLAATPAPAADTPEDTRNYCLEWWII